MCVFAWTFTIISKHMIVFFCHGFLKEVYDILSHVIQFLHYEYQFKSTIANYLYCVIQVWIQNCKNLKKKIIYTLISVMYKGIYHAFGTQILQYIIPVFFNTNSVSVYTVKCIWWLSVGLHLTRIVTWKICFTRKLPHIGMALLSS